MQAMVVLLFGVLRPAVASGDEPAPGSVAKPRAGIAVWDTGHPSTSPLEPAALIARAGWTQVPATQTAATFRGDAAMSNGRVMVVVRGHDGPAAEVFALGPRGPVARARLSLLASEGDPLGRLDHLALIENSRAAACLEVGGKTAKGTSVTARIRVKRGDVALQVEPAAGAGALRVECPARFVVLPDFFADDIVIDARATPPPRVELPSENFLLHLAGQGDALAMCVFENRQHDVKVTLSGSGKQRKVTASEIPFEGKRVWVALVEGPDVWHARDLEPGDRGKVLPLGWTMPFPGQWRVDFTRADGLTDSWEMLLQEPDGRGFVKPSWLGAGAEQLPPNRQWWNTVLGTYPYPCWSDRQGHGFVQPLRSRVLKFQGPVVTYPINRLKETPLDSFTVVDVMRNTLGVGPCEYILDLEGQKSEYRGRATCDVRDSLRPIYAKGQQAQRRAEVNQILDDGLTFVKHIRSRIEHYVEFGHAMHAYLAEQKSAHPELADFLTEMDQMIQEIDARVAARVDKIKTPEHVAAMNEQFRKDVLDDVGPRALAKCKDYTQALVKIGDNQDELAGECRWVVKTLRQKAAMRMAMDPRVAPVATEIRARTQVALRNPANHEGAHH
jgi:hypothetical protein